MKQIYKTLAFFVCVACCVTATAQMRTVTFTGRDRSGHYRIPLSRVVVFNLDQLWEEILYYPDTILVLGSVGIDDYGEKQEIQLMQNVPNPFDGTTEFALALPEKRDVLLEIYDVTGKLTVNQHFSALPAGTHLFQATLSSPQTYLLSARMDDGQMTIKMVNQGHGGENSIRHLGTTDKNGNFTVYLNNEKSYTNYPFHVGDEMRYVAYPGVGSGENVSNTVTKLQIDNETIVFNFDFIVPSVTTDEVYDITTTTATCSATVISDGNLPISKRGVCWSTSPDPTMHNDRCDNVGGVGSFTCDLSGLTEGASYYVRAYAINFLDTVYGPPKRFTTLVRPTVTTDTVSNITSTSATCGGNVTDDGGNPVTERGVCWSVSPNPTFNNLHALASSGIGSFTCNITGLTANTTYYVRAFASSSAGRAYGEERTFTTAATTPMVTTNSVSSITSTSVTCGGQVTNNGGAPVTACGVCWNTSPNPSLNNNLGFTNDNSGTGSFVSSITGLTDNTTYYVRAYATNSAGTAYGAEKTFTTLCGTVNVSITGNTTINYGESTTLNAIGAITYQWSNGANTASITVSPTSTTVYYVTGTNSNGCSGTANVTVTVNPIPPTVTTNTVTSFTATTATCGGIVTNNGGAMVTERGVCWSSTTINPTLTDIHKANGSGSGSFNLNISGLEANTTYYVRAYAIYNGGTAYGDTKTFTTSLFTCGNSTTDFDGNSYNTVLIGNQCWMKENLKTAHLNNGVSIPLVQDSTYWGYTSSPAYCYYNQGTYGCLYNFYAVAGEQLCPPGWHVPTYNEIHNQLYYTLRTDPGGKMKTTGTTYWLSPNTGATNSSGFSARGSGLRYTGSSISGIKEHAFFWTSTTYDNYYAYDYHLYYDNAGLNRWGYISYDYSFSKSIGMSVRCLRNEDTTEVSHPCPGMPTVIDIDSNVYNTVQIGQQCWMKENLRTTRYADGTSITLGSNSDTSSLMAYRYYPDLHSFNVVEYGYLYNWSAVMNGEASSNAIPSNVQGVCPMSWHVPSDAEWTQLTDYVSSQSENVCSNNTYHIAKALAATTGWPSYTDDCVVGNNQSDNNTTGFSALPAGFFGSSSSYWSGTYAYFWSSTESSSLFAYNRILGYNIAVVVRGNNYESDGYSVRCLRDGGNTSALPTVSTNTVTNITTTTASCGGNVTSDGGATVTARGVCWSTSQNPTVNDSHTSETTSGSGNGSFSSSITGLTSNTTYYVRAYATNSAGTAYGEQQSFTTASDGQPCPATPTVTDYDGITYVTVQLGTQCWMAQNLRSTHYSDGTSISLSSSNFSATVPYRYYPHNSSGNVSTYGYLYNWKAVMRNNNSSSANPSGVQGVCPTGWHVPSDAEWTQLTDYVGSQSGYQCSSSSIYIGKALASTTGWETSTLTCSVGNNQSTNNVTGFNARPAGQNDGSGYYDFGSMARFWSSTQASGSNAHIRYLYCIYNGVYSYDYNKSYAFSVRCLRN